LTPKSPTFSNIVNFLVCGIRLTTIAADRLKEKAKTAGAKNLSAYARRVLEESTAVNQDLIQEIERVMDLTIRTRTAISSLTGNINQIARFYNASATADERYREWDRRSRLGLLPAIKALIESNGELIALCKRILR
jgi:hypothetical protein